MSDDEGPVPLRDWLAQIEADVEDIDFDEVENFGLVFTWEDEDGNLQAMNGWGIDGNTGPLYSLRSASEDLTEAFRQLARQPAPNEEQQAQPPGRGFD